MANNDTILVRTIKSTELRGESATKELKVEVLAENINIFLTQIESILEKAPQQVGKFQFTEFVIAAEVSANGKMVLFGSGIEAAAKGGLTFKFQKMAADQ